MHFHHENDIVKGKIGGTAIHEIMQRGELLLTIGLVALIVAGVAYDSLRGADKTAEAIITHPANTPFDAKQPQPGTPQSATSAIGSTPIQSSSGNLLPSSKRLLEFINHASESEIDTLPGIGPVLAQRILQKRQQLGRFDSIDDLLNVSGIGKAKLDGLLEGMNPIVATPTPMIRPLFQNPAPLISRPMQPPMKPSNVKRPLNQATRDELMAVPGIGEHLADEILQARAKSGGFRSWDDVASVSGIGKKRLEKIKELFTISNAKP